MDPETNAGPLPACIEKSPAMLRVAPNLLDHAATCAAFRWDDARQQLAGLPAGGLNIAHEAVDRHLGTPREARTAIRWISKTGAHRDLSYGELARASNRFANALRSLDVQAGERVFVLMGRLPELYIAVLGALKRGCVVSPLFSAFGPEPIRTRMTIGAGRVLVNGRAARASKEISRISPFFAKNLLDADARELALTARSPFLARS